MANTSFRSDSIDMSTWLFVMANNELIIMILVCLTFVPLGGVGGVGLY